MLGAEDGHESLSAVREVQTEREGFFAVKPQSDSVAAFQVFQVDIGSTGGNFSSVAEHGDVQWPPGFPPIFGARKNAILIAETTLTKTSQALPTTQIRHEIKRDG